MLFEKICNTLFCVKEELNYIKGNTEKLLKIVDGDRKAIRNYGEVLLDQGKIVTDIFYVGGEECCRELRICLSPQEWNDLEKQFFYQELKRYFDKK